MKQYTFLLNLYNYKPIALIRPLLSTSRFDIQQVCLIWGIPVYPDKSNQSIKFQRNRVRKQLVPLLRLFWNPQVDKVCLQLAAVLSSEQKFLNTVIKKTTFELERKTMLLALLPVYSASLQTTMSIQKLRFCKRKSDVKNFFSFENEMFLRPLLQPYNQNLMRSKGLEFDMHIYKNKDTLFQKIKFFDNLRFTQVNGDPLVYLRFAQANEDLLFKKTSFFYYLRFAQANEDLLANLRFNSIQFFFCIPQSLCRRLLQKNLIRHGNQEISFHRIESLLSLLTTKQDHKNTQSFLFMAKRIENLEIFNSIHSQKLSYFANLISPISLFSLFTFFESIPYHETREKLSKKLLEKRCLYKSCSYWNSLLYYKIFYIPFAGALTVSQNTNFV